MAAKSFEKRTHEGLSGVLSRGFSRDISRGRFSDKAPVGRRERSPASKAGVDWPPIAKRSGKPRSSQVGTRSEAARGLKAFLSNFTSVSFAPGIIPGAVFAARI